ncbi:hypothetical protein ABZY57_22700 [Streptomyces sp. NPDC006450]|uniref:hypothetical protein n=1 Tax=Streptomyces sp. NPDC006450 TaxID=3155458 RepID=UPI0033AD4BA3
MKKRISAVLCTATALGAMLAAPTAAHAADPYPTFRTYANSSGIGLDFPVPQDISERPEGLKVHVRAKGTSTPVATLTSFTSSTHCVEMCDLDTPVWEMSLETGPVRLAAFGQYVVDVEYTGTEGETLLHKDRGTFDYQLTPVFEGLAAEDVSLAKRDTVVSGTVQIHDPRDSSKKPYAGGSLTVKLGGATTSIVADAQGRFTSKLTLTGDEPVYENGWQSGSHHVPVTLTASVNGVKRLDTARADVNRMRAGIALDSPTQTGAYGTRGKISGAVTWKSPDGTYKPAPARMKISAGPESPLTDTAGRFTASPMFLSDAPWTVVENSPWLYGSGRQVAVNTTAGTRFTGFGAAVDKNKTVSVNALFDRAEIPAGTTSLKVEVQHSVDGKTGWTTRKSLNVPTDAGSNTTANISTTLPYPGTGHIRLRCAGTTAIHGSVTPAVEVARTMTAIPDFNASPEPVKKGQQLTVTGRLTRSDLTWKPFGYQPVHYYFRPAGSTTWKVMGSSETAADGTFTKAFTADRTGSWTARYEETDRTHFAASSRVDEVIVNP